MFGRLKNLFSKRVDKEVASEEPSQPAAPGPVPPPRPGAGPGASARFPAAAAAAAPAPTAAPPAPTPLEETLQLPLKPIISRLPENLQSKVAKMPDNRERIKIPLRRILDQLASGVVKISFAELRQVAPSEVFVNEEDHDHLAVELPLQDIIANLNPAHLSLRPNQKRVEVPKEIGSVFGPKGQAVKPASAGTTRAARPAAAPSPAGPSSIPAPSPMITPAAPLKLSTPVPGPVQAQPAAPIRPAVPLPSPATLRPAAPAPAAAAPATAPIKASVPLPSPLALKPSTPSPSPPAAAPIKPSIPLPGTPASARSAIPSAPPGATVSPPTFKPPPPVGLGAEMIRVPLGSLMDNWPENLGQGIKDRNLTQAAVELPIAELEPGLRRGKIMMSWKQVSSWIKPTTAQSSGLAPDETQLELPLPVIVGPFLEQYRPSMTQRTITIGDNIPNMFQGKPAAAPPTATATAPPAAPAPAAPVPAIAPSPLGTIFGEPAKRDWTPQEIVQRTAQLKGVSGALIATPDGLLIAAQLPGALKAEAVAAFMPQIFGRISHDTTELNLGELSYVILMIKDVPWQLYKAGTVYFLAVGRGGESLPSVQLTTVAGELGRLSK